MAEKHGHDKVDEEALKQKYAELRVAATQIKQLQQQLEAVEEKKQELETAMASLDELKKAGGKARMLAPITDGIFAEATLESSSELIVNVGSSVCVKKSVDGAKGMLKAKAEELKGFQESLIEELTKLTEQADALEKELGQMLQEE